MANPNSTFLFAECLSFFGTLIIFAKGGYGLSSFILLFHSSLTLVLFFQYFILHSHISLSVIRKY